MRDPVSENALFISGTVYSRAIDYADKKQIQTTDSLRSALDAVCAEASARYVATITDTSVKARDIISEFTGRALSIVDSHIGVLD